MRLTGKTLIPISSRKCKCGNCRNHHQNPVEEELPPEIQQQNDVLRRYAKRVTKSEFIRIDEH